MKWRERWLQFTGDNPEVALSLDGYRAKLFWTKLHDGLRIGWRKKKKKSDEQKVTDRKRRKG